jgi:hypothetical protein
MLSELNRLTRISSLPDAWDHWVVLGGVVMLGLGLVSILVFLVRRIDYRITPRHLQVTLLGIPIRRLRLDNIRHISTRRARFGERWQNQVFVKHDRVLLIEKRRGMPKHFLITPEQRFVFRAALDRAVRVANGLPPAPTLADRMNHEGGKVPSDTGLNPEARPVAKPPSPVG